MRIIDINCMIGSWPAKQRQFREPDTLIAEMDKYRLDSCVAYHSMSLWSTQRGNALTRQMSMDSAGRIKSCYVLEPNLGSSEMPEAEALLKQLSEEKPAAVRLLPKTKNYRVDEFYCGELLEVINELKLPVLFAAEENPGFECLPLLAKAYPGIKFILLRHGFKDSRYLLPLIKKLDNIYLETGMMVDTGLIEEIVDKYGSEKLLFGSGLPFFVPAGALSLILYARIKDEDKENILGRNWLRLEERTV